MIYFVSDTHFNHRNIIKYCNRPFVTAAGEPDVPAMNEALIANWNAVVSPDDTIYHLGDFGMAKRTEFEQFASRLNGHKHLVYGNHDMLGKNNVERTVEFFASLGFETVTSQHYVEAHGHTFWLAHIPINNKADVGREYLRRPKPLQKYTISLCGHVHDAWQHLGREVNVGVDVWGMRPVSAERVILYYANILCEENA